MAGRYRMPSNPSVFIVGPIGDEHAPLETEPRQRWEDGLMMMEKVIKPACVIAGIPSSAIRADEISTPGEVPEQVMRELREADLVIADVSGANPNVMYELGLRHAVGKCTVEVGDYNRLPFDIGWIRAVKVVRTASGYVEGRDRLAAVVGAAIKHGCDELTATRVIKDLGKVTPTPADTEPPQTTDLVGEVMEPSEDRGFVDILADMEAAMPRMLGSIQAIGGVLTQVGEFAQITSEEFDAASEAGDNSMATRRDIVSKLAARLAEPAVQLDQNIADYQQFLSLVDGGVSYLFDQMEANPKLVEQAEGLPETLVALKRTTDESFSAVNTLADVLDQTATISRDISVPARSLAASLRQVRDVSAPIDRWAERAGRLIDKGRTPRAAPKVRRKQSRAKRTR